jgi:hypothetical protein
MDINILFIYIYLFFLKKNKYFFLVTLSYLFHLKMVFGQMNTNSIYPANIYRMSNNNLFAISLLNKF